MRSFLHINPLKLARINSSRETEAEPGEEQSMPLRDASFISILLSLAQYFIVFLPLKGYGDLAGAPMVFLFDSIKCLGGAFFSNLIVLAGLSKYTASKSKKNR